MLRTVIESTDDPRLSNRRPRGLAPLLTQHPLLAGALIALFLVAWLLILPLVISTVRQCLGFADFIEISFSSSNVSLFIFDFCVYFAPVWVFALWFRGNSGKFVALSDAIFGAGVLVRRLTHQTKTVDLNVIPLHPDQAGGFSFIGR